MGIPFQRHTLKNGLRLIVHEDHTTPLISCQIVYSVGSKDEDSSQTGLAHLLEHFMFCGSINIEDYDAQLQTIGAINNAFTSQDLTCYYITLPANNIETALWLESDRMLSLAFNQEQLDIQKNVVMEEFKENFLNRPFGDLWSEFYKIVFKKHPYQWLPIGKELSHIEEVKMKQVEDFYNKFYNPNNAVITIAGDVNFEKAKDLVEKWFGEIPKGSDIKHTYMQEDVQLHANRNEIFRDVPYDMLMKGWRMCGRRDEDFYAFDLLSDMLGSGQSSYLYKELVLNQKIFTDITAYITATNDPGIFVITGRPADGVTIEEADEALNQFIYNFSGGDDLERNLQKVKNKVDSILLNNEIKIEDRASILAISETISSVEDFENDRNRYFLVTEKQIIDIIRLNIVFNKENTLFYRKKK
jgi:zinc protease